jgi:exopolysaccharide biosynthesis polyprenyl glycosylphosphotransferase
VAAPGVRRPASAPRRDVRAARLGVDSALLLSRVRRAVSVVSLIAIDLCAVSLALYLALISKQIYRGAPVFWGVLWVSATDVLPFVVLIVGLVFAKNGLYRSRESRPGGAAIVASLGFSTILVALFALVTGREFNSYATFFVTFLLAVVFVTGLRASYDSATLAVMRAMGMRRRTLLAGRSEALEELYSALAQPLGGPEPQMIGTVSDAPLLVSGLAQLGEMSDLPALVRELRPDDLVLAGAELPDSALLELADACRSTRTRLRFVPTTAELLLQRASFVPGQVVPLLELRPPVLTGLEWAVKRTFDIVVATLVLIVLSPLLAAISLLVRASSPGPIIYRDLRIGVGEGEFAMLKFRSMYNDARERQAALEQHNEADGAMFKMRDDPRVTPFGRFIRRFSLDELPQLVNVLRGEMSLVGPRPLPVRDYERLSDWHRKRYAVLPGITGLWQISGRSNLSFDDLVRLDFYYLENWSVWMDVAVLLRTPIAVVRGRGAY